MARTSPKSAALSLLDRSRRGTGSWTEKAELIALLREEDLLMEDVDLRQPMPFGGRRRGPRFVSATPVPAGTGAGR